MNKIFGISIIILFAVVSFVSLFVSHYDISADKESIEEQRVAERAYYQEPLQEEVEEETKEIDQQNETPQYVNYTLSEWKERLSKEEYDILWEKGTERPFTGDLLDNNKNGTYVTAGCKIPVFHSSTKYKSGTGWPSFWAPYNDENIILKEDLSLGIKRVEVLSACGEHLGHVFSDGPEPTGLRYCINSAALDFVEEE